MARTFESLFRWITPHWLRAGDGDAVLRSLARQLDESVARVRRGLVARFPTRCGDDSILAQIGADRGIIRGRVETSEHYANRLVAWRAPRGHRVRGNAFALIEQVSEYFGGVTTWVVDYSGNWYRRSRQGVEEWAPEYDWDWDSGENPSPSPKPWARFWLVIDGSDLFDAHPALGDPALWGGAWGTPGYTIGQTGALFEDVQAIRRLFTGRAWKMAGSQEEWLVVSLNHLTSPDDRTWDDTFDETFGDPPQVVTDGWWMHWSRQVAGVQTPTRDPTCRYWSLDPEHNNTYVGYPDRFCLASIMVDGSTYAGDPTSFPASVTMPDGSTYAGDSTKFPTSVRLVDDGDPIQ